MNAERKEEEELERRRIHRFKRILTAKVRVVSDTGSGGAVCFCELQYSRFCMICSSMFVRCAFTKDNEVRCQVIAFAALLHISRTMKARNIALCQKMALCTRSSASLIYSMVNISILLGPRTACV